MGYLELILLVVNLYFGCKILIIVYNLVIYLFFLVLVGINYYVYCLESLEINEWFLFYFVYVIRF